MPKRMVATSWLLLIGLAAAGATAGVLQARAQPDSIGTLNVPRWFHNYRFKWFHIQIAYI
jgi:hypothetical protein